MDEIKKPIRFWVNRAVIGVVIIVAIFCGWWFGGFVYPKELFVSLGGIAAVAWLVQSIISHLLSKDVENYKARLVADHDIAVEKLRYDLQVQAVEHEVRFRKLHEKQAEIIAEVYENLYDLHLKLRQYVAIINEPGDPNRQQKLDLVGESNEKFKKLYFPRRLFFPEEVAKRIDAFHKLFFDVSDDFTQGLRQQLAGEGYSGHFGRADERIKSEVNPLLDQILREFQRLIGISRDPQKQVEPITTR